MQHSKYLNRCLELAQLGETGAYPNPIVGCVIVHNDQIIAEGFHHKHGEAHAEVNAINFALENYPDAEDVFKNSTIYVSLEPCSHFGKTPPCSDLIIKHQFKTLVYACSDPNPLVSGKGIAAIKEAGIAVIGPNQLDKKIVARAEYLNRVFFETIKRKSWLTLKIAVTEDGLMIPNLRKPQLQRDQSTIDGGWISNSEARKRAHRLRSTHQLLITGINTIKNDNPELNVRHNAQELSLLEIKNPDILILEDQTNFSNDERKKLKVFNQDSKQRKVIEYKQNQDYQDIQNLVTKLYTQHYTKILIEAGPKLSKAFIESGRTNELVIYQKLSTKLYKQLENTQIGLVNELPELNLEKLFLDRYLAKHQIKYCHLDFVYIQGNEVPDLEIKITKE